MKKLLFTILLSISTISCADSFFIGGPHGSIGYSTDDRYYQQPYRYPYQYQPGYGYPRQGYGYGYHYFPVVPQPPVIIQPPIRFNYNWDHRWERRHDWRNRRHDWHKYGNRGWNRRHHDDD